MDLEGKVAIITGASSGIGEAYARALQGEGVKLVIAGQRAERLDAFARKHDGVRVLAGDIVDPRVVDATFDLAFQAFGRLDIVVNNAGYMVADPIDRIDIDQVARMVRINVESAFRVMYKAMKHFKSVGTGHLVNTSSISGLKTAPEGGAYAGTKHAIEALAHALRLEVARTDIRVTNLQPGLVATELHRDFEVPMAVKRNIAQPLQPDDIARALLFALKQPDHVRIAAVLIVPGESGL
jgi:NADP-dependent 3-hydroxy acid dehydrogenase YdfG